MVRDLNHLPLTVADMKLLHGMCIGYLNREDPIETERRVRDAKVRAELEAIFAQDVIRPGDTKSLLERLKSYRQDSEGAE